MQAKAFTHHMHAFHMRRDGAGFHNHAHRTKRPLKVKDFKTQRLCSSGSFSQICAKTASPAGAKQHPCGNTHGYNVIISGNSIKSAKKSRFYKIWLLPPEETALQFLQAGIIILINILPDKKAASFILRKSASRESLCARFRIHLPKHVFFHRIPQPNYEQTVRMHALLLTSAQSGDIIC